MLNDVFGQDFTDGVKSKANFPPLDAFTTKDGHLVVKTTVAGYAPDQVNVQILPEGILEISGTARPTARRATSSITSVNCRTARSSGNFACRRTSRASPWPS